MSLDKVITTNCSHKLERHDVVHGMRCRRLLLVIEFTAPSLWRLLATIATSITLYITYLPRKQRIASTTVMRRNGFDVGTNLFSVFLIFVNFVVSVLILISKWPVPSPPPLFTQNLTTVTLSPLKSSKISDKSSLTYSKFSCSCCGQSS